MNHDRETYRECAYTAAERTGKIAEAAGIVVACMLCFFAGFLVGGG